MLQGMCAHDLLRETPPLALNESACGDKPAGSRRRVLLLRLLIGLTVLAGMFALRVSLPKTLRWLGQARPELMVAAFAVMCVGDFVSALKWQLLLRMAGCRVRTWSVVRASVIGVFYSNFLPGSFGGDVVKSLLVAESSGGKARAVASVFMQRNTGFASLLLIANVASWVRPLHVSLFPPRLGLLNNVAFWFGALTVAYLAVNAVLMSSRLYGWFWHGLERVIAQRPGQASAEATGSRLALRVLEAGRRVHDSLFLFHRAIPVATGISLLTQLNDCFMVFLIARALGLDLPFGYFCIFLPAVTLSALLPITVNGIGLRESVYVVLLHGVGVSPERAMGISLAHYGLILVMAFLGGMLHWFEPQRSKPGA